MRALLPGLMVVSIAAGARAQPCCGPITPEGERLARFLDSSDVMSRWLAGWHVDWRTGDRDRAAPGGPEAKTHCSAFVAAMAERLGAYVLRPPEHSQELLANAQMRWLREHGSEQGWWTEASDMDAQAAANRGELVLESFENPNPHRPGHIAIVRRASRRARNWTARAHRRLRLASRTPSAPRRPLASGIILGHGGPQARVACSTMHTR